MRTLAACLLALTAVPLAAQVILDQRLGFEENRGQFPPAVRYVRRPWLAFTPGSFIVTPGLLSLGFDGASPEASFQASDSLAGSVNVYSGNDPSKWFTGIPRYATIRAAGIYPGIDASFPDGDNLTCVLTVAPGANSAAIRIHVTGASRLAIGPTGALDIYASSFAGLSLGVPSAQLSPGGPSPVAIQWTTLDSSHVGFTVGAYDPSRTLTIQFAFGLPAPALVFQSSTAGIGPSNSSYLAASIAHVVTSATDNGVCGAWPDGSTVVPCQDAVLARYTSGGALQTLSYLQGKGAQQPIVVRATSRATSAGEDVFVSGTTSSTDFPTTPGAFQRAFGGSLPGSMGVNTPPGDIFLAKFDGLTGALAYSTLLGGPEADGFVDLHVSPNGDGSVYVTGFGPGLPATNAVSQTSGTGFVAHIAPQGDRLQYLTYLPVLPEAADVGADGSYYFASGAPPGFPATPGAYETQGTALRSAVLAKLNPAGTALQYATYFTDFNSFFAENIAVDSAGNAWFTVETNTNGVIRCCLLAKLDASGSKVLYSGPFIDQSPNPVSIAVHADQLIAYSTTAPISEPRPPSINCGGKYVTKLDQSGKTIFVKSIPWNGMPAGIDTSGNAVFVSGAFNGPVDFAVDRVDIATNSQAGTMCVLNAASLMRARAVAPGEIVTIFGSGLGPAAGVVFQLDSNARVPTEVGGTRVLFNGVPGPVLYAGDTQVNAIVPFGVPAGADMEVTVEYQGQQLPPYRTVVSASEPDIFTLNAGGSGEAVAFNQDGTPNSDQNPAAPGSIVTIFLTGLGDTRPPSIEGAVAASIAPAPIAPFTLGVGGPPAQIEYIGPSPGSLTSITQVNFRIPGYAVPGPNFYQLIAGTDEWGPLRQVVVAVR